MCCQICSHWLVPACQSKRLLPDCCPVPAPPHTFAGLNPCACLRARAACLPPLVAAGFCEGTACIGLRPSPDTAGSALLACGGLEGAKLTTVLPGGLSAMGTATLWAAARGVVLLAGCSGSLKGAWSSRLL